MSRRKYVAPIEIEELEDVRERVGLANERVSGLLSKNASLKTRLHGERMSEATTTELQRVQGHLSWVRQQLKTLMDRTAVET